MLSVHFHRPLRVFQILAPPPLFVLKLLLFAPSKLLLHDGLYLIKLSLDLIWVFFVYDPILVVI